MNPTGLSTGQGPAGDDGFNAAWRTARRAIEAECVRLTTIQGRPAALAGTAGRAVVTRDVLLAEVRREARLRYRRQQPRPGQLPNWFSHIVLETSFRLEWSSVQDSVLRTCRYALARHTGNSGHDLAVEADAVRAATMARAWRAYPTFQHQAAFATWVTRIAKNLAIDHSRKLSRIPSAVDLDTAEPAALRSRPGTAATTPVGRLGNDLTDHAELARLRVVATVDSLLSEAMARGILSPQEVRIIQIRLERPDQSLEQIGVELGESANQLAARRSRAIPKLRTLVYRHHLNLLGGADVVREAFERASVATVEPLTPAEHEAFDHLVLRRTDYRRRGWKGALDRALVKVGAQLDLSDLVPW